MNKTIGFLGAGNMGKAIIKGIIASNITPSKNIIVYDVYQPAVAEAEKNLKITGAASEVTVAEQSDMIILAVKPNTIGTVLDTIGGHLKENTVVVSIAAGRTLAQLESHLPEGTKIVRVMPNTPALVSMGMSALSPNAYVTDEDKAFVADVFRSFGKAEFVGEYLMDAVVGVSGSAPAYVYMFIEALADGAVLAGMPRAQAYQFAAQTVLGSAQMVLETGKHPGELKDMVTSPGGTTIAAVQSLENDGFRSAVINAVLAAAEKNKVM